MKYDTAAHGQSVDLSAMNELVSAAMPSYLLQDVIDPWASGTFSSDGRSFHQARFIYTHPVELQAVGPRLAKTSCLCSEAGSAHFRTVRVHCHDGREKVVLAIRTKSLCMRK